MAVKKIDDSSNPDEGNVAGKIEVEGKEYSAEDIQNLINQGATATKKAQEVAGVIAAAEKYGVDVETYIAQAEGVFGVMNQLIKDGIIDEKGNKIAKKETPLAKGNDEDDLAKLFNLPVEEEKGLKGADKIASIVAKALEPQLNEVKKLADRVSAVDKTQGDMIRMNLQEKVMSKFPVLKPSDVSQVFGSAMNDRTKTLWDHAEALANVKTAELGALREAHAKEFGIDLKNFDENKIKEQDAKGGAGVLFKGKKFSFDAKKGDKDVVSPRQASMEFIENVSSS